MEFYSMSNQIGMDAGCVLEGTISLNTGYHLRLVLGIQSCMKWTKTSEEMEM